MLKNIHYSTKINLNIMVELHKTSDRDIKIIETSYLMKKYIQNILTPLITVGS